LLDQAVRLSSLKIISCFGDKLVHCVGWTREESSVAIHNMYAAS